MPKSNQLLSDSEFTHHFETHKLADHDLAVAHRWEDGVDDAALCFDRDRNLLLIEENRAPRQITLAESMFYAARQESPGGTDYPRLVAEWYYQIAAALRLAEQLESNETDVAALGGAR